MTSEEDVARALESVDGSRPRDLVEEFQYAQTRAAVLGKKASPMMVGRFELRSVMGSGGMGAVFAAHDPKLGRDVALKRVLVDGEDARAKLVAEARSLAQVRHPSVVTIYDVETSGEEVFLTMEKLGGARLAAEKAAWAGWRDVATVYRSVLTGLVAALNAGVLHGDVKPANIVTDGDVRVVLIDFGLSQVHGVGEGIAVGGTPQYMSPRRKEGGELRPESDVYALLVAMEEHMHPFSPPATFGKLFARNRQVPESVTSDQLLTVLSAALRRRTWPLWAGAALLSASAAAVALWAGGESEPSALSLCERGAGELVDDWRERKASVLGAIDRGGPQIDQGLVAYAESFSTHYQAACRKTLVEGTRTEVQLEASRQCFSERASAFRELVDAAQKGLAKPRSLVRASFSLPAPEDCLDQERLLRAPLPSDAQRREQIGDAYREVARLKERLALGLFKETEAEVGELISQTEALGYDPLIAEAHVLDYRRMSAASAEVSVLRALETAAAAANRGRADLLMAKIWTAAVTGAANLGQFDRAREYEERALLAVERLGSPSREVAELDFARAVARQKEGQPKEALALAEGVLATRLEHRASAYSLAGAETLVGTLHLDLHDAAAAVSAFESAQERLRATVGGDHPQLARVQHTIGDAKSDLGDYDSALQYYRSAAATMRAEYGDTHLGLAITLGSIGVVETERKNFSEAEDALRESLAIKTALSPPDSPHLAFAQEQLGALAIERGQYDEALALFQSALAQRQKTLADDSLPVAYTRVRIGIAQAYRKKTSDSHEAFAAADAVFVAKLGKDSPARGLILYQHGLVLQRQERFAEAAEQYRAAYTHWNARLPSTDPRSQSVLEGLVACYEALDKTAESEKFRRELALSPKAP